MDRSFERQNDESRERLARLVATLTPTQLAIDLGEGWTVASALAHTGFWDRWQAARWEQMLAGQWSAEDESVIESEHLANEALHPYWAGIAAEDIPQLALDAATRLDALIASAPDDVAEKLVGGPSEYLLRRHRHRADHIDHIERYIKAAGPTLADTLDLNYDARNDASRARLTAFAAALTDADLTRPVGDGTWSVGMFLCHMAFWDRFLATRWRAALAGGALRPLAVDQRVSNMLNDALPAQWAALAAAGAEAVRAEVVAAADDVDSTIGSLPSSVPLERVFAERPALLDRSLHRDDHLDELDKALAR